VCDWNRFKGRHCTVALQEVSAINVCSIAWVESMYVVDSDLLCYLSVFRHVQADFVASWHHFCIGKFVAGEVMKATEILGSNGQHWTNVKFFWQL